MILLKLKIDDITFLCDSHYVKIMHYFALCIIAYNLRMDKLYQYSLREAIQIKLANKIENFNCRKVIDQR